MKLWDGLYFVDCKVKGSICVPGVFP
jgi:hypothetical protein